jgi:hypothetical protein
VNSEKVIIVTPHYSVGSDKYLPIPEVDDRIVNKSSHLLERVVDVIKSETLIPYPTAPKELCFFCSTYLPAKQTMDIYKQAFGLLDDQVVYNDLLRPIKHGDLTNDAFGRSFDTHKHIPGHTHEHSHQDMTTEAIYAQVSARMEEDVNFKMPNGESVNDTTFRIADFLIQFYKREKQAGHVLPIILTHKYLAHYIYIALCGKDGKLIEKCLDLPASGVYVLDTANGRVEGEYDPFFLEY